MARKIANTRNGPPKNLLWITGIVVGILALCAGGVAMVRLFNPAQPTPLPIVPTFGFVSPSPIVVSGISTATLPSAQVTPTFLPTFTSTPLPTPTNSSIFNWIFPNFLQRIQPTTAVPFRSPTPLQVVVITLAPTATPTGTSIPPPPTQGPPNPLVCKNVLYPARPGNQWTYYVTTPNQVGNVNLRVASVEGTQAAIDVTDLSDGSSGRGYAQCEQDIILNFPLLGVQNIINNFVSGNMNMDYYGGVLAPNESAFVSSNWALSWIIQYLVYGNGSVTRHGTVFNFSMSPSAVNMNCQTVGFGDAAFENVTVTAGTYRALKVVCRGEGQVNAVVNGSQVTGTISAQATQWFAPNIGLLRLQSDYVYLNVFGISIPLNSTGNFGSIELTSYFVGQ